MDLFLITNCKIIQLYKNIIDIIITCVMYGFLLKQNEFLENNKDDYTKSKDVKLTINTNV